MVKDKKEETKINITKLINNNSKKVTYVTVKESSASRGTPRSNIMSASVAPDKYIVKVGPRKQIKIKTG